MSQQVAAGVRHRELETGSSPRLETTRGRVGTKSEAKTTEKAKKKSPEWARKDGRTGRETIKHDDELHLSEEEVTEMDLNLSEEHFAAGTCREGPSLNPSMAQILDWRAGSGHSSFCIQHQK